eukprot:gene11386-biopygen6275
MLWHVRIRVWCFWCVPTGSLSLLVSPVCTYPFYRSTRYEADTGCAARLCAHRTSSAAYLISASPYTPSLLCLESWVMGGQPRDGEAGTVAE